MVLADLRRLVKFNDWANARVCAEIDTLSSEQLTKDLGSSFPSVLATAGHLVGAEWIWLRRWLGDQSPVFPDWAKSPEWREVKRQLAGVETERNAFMSRLTEADILTLRPFKLLNGTSDEQPLDVMVTHIVNHSSYHRGQIAAMFRQLGLKPTGTDFITFAREK